VYGKTPANSFWCQLTKSMGSECCSSDLYLALHSELLRRVLYMAGVFVPSLGLRLVHLDQRLQ